MIRIAGCRLNGRSGHDAGRELLQILYHLETGHQILPEIQTTPRGKPYFPGNTLHFSISHTQDHAFCALSHSPVGIDAEELNRPVHRSLPAKVLSPAEMAQYQASADQNQTFLTFWVLKEAAAKQSGLGLRGFPNHTCFVLPDSRVQQWDGCVFALIAEPDAEGETFYAF